VATVGYAIGPLIVKRHFGVGDVVAPVRVGYVMGSGDEVPAAIERMGLRVTMLSETDLAAGDLQDLRFGRHQRERYGVSASGCVAPQEPMAARGREVLYVASSIDATITRLDAISGAAAA